MEHLSQHKSQGSFTHWCMDLNLNILNKAIVKNKHLNIQNSITLKLSLQRISVPVIK